MELGSNPASPSSATVEPRRSGWKAEFEPSMELTFVVASSEAKLVPCRDHATSVL